MPWLDSVPAIQHITTSHQSFSEVPLTCYMLKHEMDMVADYLL